MTVTAYWGARRDDLDGRVEILSDEIAGIRPGNPAFGRPRALQTWADCYTDLPGAVLVRQELARGQWREPTDAECSRPAGWPEAEWSPAFPDGYRMATSQGDARHHSGDFSLVIRDVAAGAWVEVEP